MSIDRQLPDYRLDDLRIISSPEEIKATFHSLREQLLELMLERAATVSEMAAAVKRPRSTVAHHINVLLDAGLVRVIRTRRVRAIDERFYGRVARVFYVGQVQLDQLRDIPNPLASAARDSQPAYEADRLRAIVRHVRIPRERAAEFWDRVLDLTRDFSAIPREGETVYGFVAGLYPTGQPSLPDPAVED
jgi:DNA-binding transcriptional ArsR family regulator